MRQWPPLIRVKQRHAKEARDHHWQWDGGRRQARHSRRQTSELAKARARAQMKPQGTKKMNWKNKSKPSMNHKRGTKKISFATNPKSENLINLIRWAKNDFLLHFKIFFSNSPNHKQARDFKRVYQVHQWIYRFYTISKFVSELTRKHWMKS